MGYIKLGMGGLRPMGLECVMCEIRLVNGISYLSVRTWFVMRKENESELYE